MANLEIHQAALSDTSEKADFFFKNQWFGFQILMNPIERAAVY